jgi:hypothetical protein
MEECIALFNAWCIPKEFQALVSETASTEDRNRFCKIAFDILTVVMPLRTGVGTAWQRYVDGLLKE